MEVSLNSLCQVNAWAMAAGDTDPWIMADLGDVWDVKTITTKGRSHHASRVESYKISYSDTSDSSMVWYMVDSDSSATV